MSDSATSQHAWAEPLEWAEIRRGKWKKRIVWGFWWREFWRPMPFIFHRWDVWTDNKSWCAGFWRLSSAKRYVDELTDDLDGGKS